ncbi:hypothetical protein EJ08DRAFT_651704, partial [Tothia fuscella]
MPVGVGCKTIATSLGWHNLINRKILCWYFPTSSHPLHSNSLPFTSSTLTPIMYFSVLLVLFAVEALALPAPDPTAEPQGWPWGRSSTSTWVLGPTAANNGWSPQPTWPSTPDSSRPCNRNGPTYQNGVYYEGCSTPAPEPSRPCNKNGPTYVNGVYYGGCNTPTATQQPCNNGGQITIGNIIYPACPGTDQWSRPQPPPSTGCCQGNEYDNYYGVISCSSPCSSLPGLRSGGGWVRLQKNAAD